MPSLPWAKTGFGPEARPRSRRRGARAATAQRSGSVDQEAVAKRHAAEAQALLFGLGAGVRALSCGAVARAAHPSTSRVMSAKKRAASSTSADLDPLVGRVDQGRGLEQGHVALRRRTRRPWSRRRRPCATSGCRRSRASRSARSPRQGRWPRPTRRSSRQEGVVAGEALPVTFSVNSSTTLVASSARRPGDEVCDGLEERLQPAAHVLLPEARRDAAVDQDLGVAGDHVFLLRGRGHRRHQGHAEHRLGQVGGEQRRPLAHLVQGGGELAGPGVAELALEHAVEEGEAGLGRLRRAAGRAGARAAAPASAARCRPARGRSRGRRRRGCEAGSARPPSRRRTACTGGARRARSEGPPPSLRTQVRADLLRVLLAKPLGADQRTRLLVGRADEQQLAGGPPALPRQRDAGGRLGRDLVLHVLGAAPAHLAVDDVAGPGREAPFRGVGGHGVGVAEQAEGGARAGSPRRRATRFGRSGSCAASSSHSKPAAPRRSASSSCTGRSLSGGFDVSSRISSPSSVDGLSAQRAEPPSPPPASSSTARDTDRPVRDCRDLIADDRLFDEAAPTGAPACRPPRRRWRCGCARARSTSWSGQDELLAGGLAAANRDRVGRAALGDPPRPARHRARRRWPGSSRRRPRGAFEEESAVNAGRRRGARRDRPRRGAPPRHQPADDLLPRRDPPLQQGASRTRCCRRSRRAS